jgi:hypothetical protein
MEVGGQLHAPAAVLRDKSTRYPWNRRRDRPQSRSESGSEEKKSCHYRESNRGRPAHSLVTVLTELSQTLIISIPSFPVSCPSGQLLQNNFFNYFRGVPEDLLDLIHWIQRIKLNLSELSRIFLSIYMRHFVITQWISINFGTGHSALFNFGPYYINVAPTSYKLQEKLLLMFLKEITLQRVCYVA